MLRRDRTVISLVARATKQYTELQVKSSPSAATEKAAETGISRAFYANVSRLRRPGPWPHPPPGPAARTAAPSGSCRRRRRAACPPCRAAPTGVGHHVREGAAGAEAGDGAALLAPPVRGRRRAGEGAAGRLLKGGDGCLTVGQVVERLPCRPPRSGRSSALARRAGRSAS